MLQKNRYCSIRAATDDYFSINHVVYKTVKHAFHSLLIYLTNSPKPKDNTFTGI